MLRSLAHQSEAELGGARSVLERQKRDHVELERLLRAIDAASGVARQDLLTNLCRLVFPHAFAEEAVLWPALRRLLPDGDALTLRVEREHQQINELFTQLERSAPGSEQHRELWARIVELLRRDVRDEEDVLLPRLQEVADAKQLAALGRSWELVRRTAPTRPHPVVSRRPTGNVVAAAPLTVIDRTRDHLDRVARRGTGLTGRLTRWLSRALARLAGLVERLPLSRIGEHPSTHASRSAAYRRLGHGFSMATFSPTKSTKTRTFGERWCVLG